MPAVIPIAASVAGAAAGKLFSGGGSSGGGPVQENFGSQAQLYNRNPEWVGKAGEDVFNRAKSVADTPYQAYTGEQVAPISRNQQLAVTNAGQAIGRFAPTYGTITDYLNQSANPYGQTFTPTNATYDKVSTTANPQAITTKDWTQADQDAYMNPYLKASLDPQLAGINQDYATRQNIQNAAAAGGGNFGGSRAAVNSALITKQQQDQLNGVRAQGYNNAYNTGLQAFQTDQGRNLQGQQAQADIYGRDIANRLQSDLANQSAGMNTSQFNAKQDADAFNTNFNVFKNDQDSARQAAQGFNNLTRTQQQNTDAIQKNLLDSGAVAQQNQQAQDTVNYQNFLEQRGYPKEQASYLASILSSNPNVNSITHGQNVVGNNGVSNLAGVIGTGLNQAGGLFGGGSSVPGMNPNPTTWVNPDTSPSVPWVNPDLQY